MTKTPEQEADELVEMFRPYSDRGIEDSSRFEIESAIEIAIIHVERLIEAMNELLKDYPIGKVYHYHQHYQQVLEILKSKN